MSSGRDTGHGPASAATCAPAVDEILAAVHAVRRPLVLIDGPSGSGKSTLADVVARGWRGRSPRIVRLDDVYPGWHGLDRASRAVARTLVRPWLRGVPGGYRRWDWAESTLGASVSVVPGAALIVEGCGAFAVAAPGFPAIRIWVSAADDARRPRALTRDAGAFDPFWEVWDRQWRAYVRRCNPYRHATITVETGRDPR
jgi:energy-coupling factor transporter ATP-binding protein EcfA2